MNLGRETETLELFPEILTDTATDIATTDIATTDIATTDTATTDIATTDTATDTATVASVKNRILAFCHRPQARDALMTECGFKNKNYFLKKYVRPLIESGELRMTLPDKPNSRNQKYVASKRGVE